MWQSMLTDQYFFTERRKKNNFLTKRIGSEHLMDSAWEPLCTEEQMSGGVNAWGSDVQGTVLHSR